MVRQIPEYATATNSHAIGLIIIIIIIIGASLTSTYKQHCDATGITALFSFVADNSKSTLSIIYCAIHLL